MPDAIIIELDGVTAGFVILQRNGFRFVCCDTRFRSLDSRKFDRLRKVYSRVEAIVQRMPKVPAASFSLLAQHRQSMTGGQRLPHL